MSRQDGRLTSSVQMRAGDPHVQLSERPRLADLPEGRFGRLFPDLQCQNATGDALLKYGAADGALECRSEIHEGTRLGIGWRCAQRYSPFHFATASGVLAFS
jgi:hypothetical protein